MSRKVGAHVSTNGDEARPSADKGNAISILLDNHRKFLRFLERRIGSRADAEEILQAAFVRTLEKSGKIRNAENVVAWFYRLLRNAVVDYYRRRGAGRRSLEKFARELSHDDKADPSTERAVCECIQTLVPILKPEYAGLITKVDLHGGDVKSVAKSLGLTAGNTRVRLHRARAALRKEVERTCRTCATHGCLDCTCAGKSRPRAIKS